MLEEKACFEITSVAAEPSAEPFKLVSTTDTQIRSHGKFSESIDEDPYYGLRKSFSSFE